MLAGRKGCGGTMRRRTRLQGAGAARAPLAAPVSAAPTRRPPNFVIVLCDDLGYGDVSIYGPGGIKTPAVERMAREGVVLTDYYAPANPCSPSRAGLLPGRHPAPTGLRY